MGQNLSGKMKNNETIYYKYLFWMFFIKGKNGKNSILTFLFFAIFTFIEETLKQIYKKNFFSILSFFQRDFVP